MTAEECIQYTVHNMNGKSHNDNSLRSLQLLEELSRDESASQRDLSKRLGIAVGLVNSYVKNMISKGYIRVSSFPKNRYKYLLTPKGIAEKTRLTYHHLHYFTNLYTTARKDFRNLFSALEEEGVHRVIFCGVDEVAEIAYLSLQETGIGLAGIVDMENHGAKFFRHSVADFDAVSAIQYDRIIVTSLKKRSELIEFLRKFKVDENKICSLEINGET